MLRILKNYVLCVYSGEFFQERILLVEWLVSPFLSKLVSVLLHVGVNKRKPKSLFFEERRQVWRSDDAISGF